MIEPTYIELMNLELDGTATESQRAQLRRYLDGNPEAAAHYDALSRVVRRLDAQALVEPPAQLHPRIMAAVDRVERAPAGGGSWIASLLAPARRRTFATFGVGLATGVFLLAAVQWGRSGGWEATRGLDPSAVSGTMSRPAPGDAAIALDPASGLGGSFELSTEQGVTVIRAHLEAPDPVDWTLDFGRGLSVRRIDAPDNAAVVFGAPAGEIRARHDGAGDYRIVLSGRAEPAESVVLKVVKDGQVVSERTAAPIR